MHNQKKRLNFAPLLRKSRGVAQPGLEYASGGRVVASSNLVTPTILKVTGVTNQVTPVFIISIEPISFFFLYFYNNGVWRCVEIYKSNAMKQ